MSRRIVFILVALLAVVGGAAAFVWLHAGGQSKVHFTPDPPVKDSGAASGNSEGIRPQPATPEAPAEKAPTIKQPAAAAAPEAEPVFAPATGEVLEFTGSVAKVNNVASLRLLVSGKQQIAGKDAWHLQAFAHTQNPLRLVFELDDQFDSYSVPGDFVSVQYEMHLSERGQKVQSVERLTPTGKEPAPAGVAAARVLPGTRDPLGL